MPSDQEYTVGWICVLRKELEAAKDTLDENFGDQFDKQLYTLGRIRDHAVVITCFPMGDKGNNMAAIVAERMMGKFPNIKVGLLVGIGGGLPYEGNDVRLGDVVVSAPAGTHPGVVQFDMGKYTTAGFERTGFLNAPPEELRAVLNSRMPPHGSQLIHPPLKPYPGEDFDQLYDANYEHIKGEGQCNRCDKQRLVPRVAGNRAGSPRVFYGTIASGNAVIKDAAKRDALVKEHGVLCCEMEAAGLMKTTFPCLVVRGISDYADSHKNDMWQDYAAAAASQYAKDFLCEIPPGLVGRLEPIQDETQNIYWCMPHPAKTFFTGRATVLRRIEDALNSNEQQRSFGGVFWVDASSDSTAKAGFLTISRELRSHLRDIASICLLLSNTNYDWLLILDNADDPRFDYTAYIPSGNRGAVIMTSRNPECKVYNTVGFEELGGLDEKDCKALLLMAAKIPMQSWPKSDKAAKDIIKNLESHTLALVQAGAYIAQGYCSLEEYPEVFQMHRKRLLEFHLSQEQPRYHSVYSTFEASAKELESHSDALDLLNVLSMLHYADIPIKLFNDAWSGCRKIYDKNERELQGIGTLTTWHASLLPKFVQGQLDKWDPFRLMNAVNLLRSLALINKNQEKDAISMHSLTHAWVNERQTQLQKRQFWRETGAVLALSCYGQSPWRSYYSQIKPHLQTFFNMAMKLSRPPHRIIQMLFQCGWLLHHSHDDIKLRDLLKRIFHWLEIDQNFPVIDHLPLYDLLSRNLNRLGKHKMAIDLLRKMDIIQDATLVPGDLDQHRLALKHELASAYLGNGQVTKAVRLLEHVVDVEQSLPKDDPDRLASEHELGGAYLDNGQIEMAVKLLEHVVDVQSSLPKDHPQRLASEHELGSAYLEDGQIEMAVKLLEHVVDVQKNLLQDHPDRLASEHELARAYRKGKQSREAVKVLRHVVEIQKSFPKDHPARLRSELELEYAINDQAGREDISTLSEFQSGVRKSFGVGQFASWKKVKAEFSLSVTNESRTEVRTYRTNPEGQSAASFDVT
ncbi:hypothetical protein TCE0_013r01029 [Talaromyces pinophilus]|uniref:Nucleoside phosphorylase domain-containing protein n=1 Tax=Talaromyces pinophilus TaxID=128442 RepID=A0A698XLK7_TALPI|nr:hypothetical protein TCE0_013r01029 [Talaromyces pinophilus]